jgi:hypothetical protein
VQIQTKTGLQALYLFMAYLIPAFNSSDYDELWKWYSLKRYTMVSFSTSAVTGCLAASVLCDKVAGMTRHDKTDACSIYLTHCGNSSKTLMTIAGLRAKISNWLLLNMIQDSNLNIVQSKEMTYQHQMPISFNLGELPLLVQTSNTERIVTKPV